MTHVEDLLRAGVPVIAAARAAGVSHYRARRVARDLGVSTPRGRPRHPLTRAEALAASAAHGTKSAAIRALGVARGTFYARLAEHPAAGGGR